MDNNGTGQKRNHDSFSGGILRDGGIFPPVKYKPVPSPAIKNKEDEMRFKYHLFAEGDRSVGIPNYEQTVEVKFKYEDIIDDDPQFRKDFEKDLKNLLKIWFVDEIGRGRVIDDKEFRKEIRAEKRQMEFERKYFQNLSEKEEYEDRMEGKVSLTDVSGKNDIDERNRRVLSKINNAGVKA